MKKYLQFSFMCFLVLSVSVFGSCKEDEGGSPSPLLGLSVKMAEKDSLVNTMISIDQANRLVTISLSKPAVDLEHVFCTFYLVNGAALYSPSLTNPVMMDLNDKNGVNITTGDAIVCYDIVTEVDYALKDIQAMAGDVEGVVSIDQKQSLVEIYFNDEVDLTQIHLDFEISAVSTMVEPSTTSALMDLSADTTRIKMYNKFSGEVIYKLICWYSGGSEYLPITGVNATVTPTEENTYTITTTGAGAAIVTARYPSMLGTILSFEYKSADSIGRPLLNLDVRNKELRMYGYVLDRQADWTSYSIDLGGVISGVGVAPSYLLTMGLGDEIGQEIEIRNLQVRERTPEELEAYEGAYVVEMKEGGDANNMSFADLTASAAYPTYQLTGTGSDPYKRALKHTVTLTADDNQLYYEYKSEAPWSWQIFWRAINDEYCCYPNSIPQHYPGPGGAKPSNLVRTTLPASDVWVAVHADMTSGVAALFKAHPDAGTPDDVRWDFDQFTTDKSVIVRNLRLEKKR